MATSVRLGTSIANSADKLLCEVLTHRAPLHDSEVADVVRSSWTHQLHAALFDVVQTTGAYLPHEPSEQLRNLALRSAATSLAAEGELQGLLQELDASGVRPLILKGAGLAYSVYRSPALRVWRDIDLLFREDDVARAARVLRARGYVGPETDVKSVVSYECTYRRLDGAGNDYKVDLHWKINNAQLLARALGFRELWDEAIPLPRLSPLARTLSRVHAFLLACVHRIGHFHAPFYVDGEPRYAGDHLRWVFDIHLLAESLSREEWSRVIRCAVANRLAHACWNSLCAATAAFHTSLPNDLTALRRAAARTQGAMGSGSRFAWMLANLRALPTVGERTLLLKEVLFPPAAYVREKYHVRASSAALPVWYAYRIARGLAAAARCSRPDDRTAPSHETR